MYSLPNPNFEETKHNFALKAITLDCSQIELWGEGFESKVKEIFQREGAVFIQNTGLTDPTEIRKLAEILIDQQGKYEGGANARSSIMKNVFDTGAPGTAWLHYHHEMEYINETPDRIAFMALDFTEGLGHNYLSNSLQATKDILQTELGQKIKAKGVCYKRYLTNRDACTEQTGGVYNHWQQSFMTDDPEEAERIARQKGFEVEWGPQLYMEIKYKSPAFEYCPELDTNILYCSQGNSSHWFDKYPVLGDLPQHMRPFHLYLGDESMFTKQEIQQMMDIYAHSGIKIPYKTGDLAVFCNTRFAHGRPAFYLEEGQSRKMGVMMQTLSKKLGQREDKWNHEQLFLK